jgi:hypothetical protein
MEIIKTVGKLDILITRNQLSAIGIKEGNKIRIEKYTPQITSAQLRFVHAYFQFCINSGGDQAAHYDAHAFWTDAKGWIRIKYPYDKDYEKITLSNMSMLKLEKILKVIDLELMQERLEIDTSFFWTDYQNWKDSGTDQSFSDWINSRGNVI